MREEKIMKEKEEDTRRGEERKKGKIKEGYVHEVRSTYEREGERR